MLMLGEFPSGYRMIRAVGNTKQEMYRVTLTRSSLRLVYLFIKGE